MNVFTVIRTRFHAASLVLALALLLPFVQFGGFVHALSHLTAPAEATGGEKSIAPADTCDACAGYSALGGPLGAMPPAIAAAPLAQPRAGALGAREAQSLAPRPYHSRAPPAPLA